MELKHIVVVLLAQKKKKINEKPNAKEIKIREWKC